MEHQQGAEVPSSQYFTYTDSVINVRTSYHQLHFPDVREKLKEVKCKPINSGARFRTQAVQLHGRSSRLLRICRHTGPPWWHSHVDSKCLNCVFATSHDSKTSSKSSPVTIAQLISSLHGWRKEMTVLVARILKSLFHPKTALLLYIPWSLKASRYAEDAVVRESSPSPWSECVWVEGGLRMKECWSLSSKNVLSLPLLSSTSIFSLCKENCNGLHSSRILFLPAACSIKSLPISGHCSTTGFHNVASSVPHTSCPGTHLTVSVTSIALSWPQAVTYEGPCGHLL